MKTIDVYNQQAEEFNAQYLSKTAEEVHASWLEFLPKQGQALDVGAGVGRDALWLAQSGLEVIAVEPAQKLRELGQQLTSNQSVFWIDDTLPALTKVFELEMRFDLIVLSAVWMHVPKSDRERAFRKLANLLKPDGVLVISLRHGNSPDAREMFPVSVDEVSGFAQQQGLVVQKIVSDSDKLNRPEVYWETMVFKLPDDGTGAFPTLRNILINDAKSSTYKLALIRVLLRIADGHPGAVLQRKDKQVILPLGLISLYWARQYMPLVKAGIQQNSNANKGLGFITAEGWDKLSARSAADFAVGNLFLGDDAKALHKMLKDIGTTIKNMPAKYIKLPNTDQQVFEVDTFSCRLTTPALFTDFETLAEFGEFAIPERIWELMSLYACWIEPVAINEWVQVMQGYKNNQTMSKSELFNALNWMAPERDTQLARSRFLSVQQEHEMHCVWSHQKLNKRYDIDHCLPYARWPNNDLWNLLPTSQQVNRMKSDKIASLERLTSAKDNISDWWKNAWLVDESLSNRFLAEVGMSLPGLRGNGFGVDEIFEALAVQHIRVREMQQLVVW